MIPSGTEPHDFEPKARDIEELSNADVFVYNGLGMETWVDKALEIVGDGRLIVVNASKGCSPLRSDELSNEGNYDPHLWVSLKGAEIEAKNIMEALIKADSKNTSYYEKNYAEFYNSLERLVNEYSEKFKRLPNRNFVTGHAAFAYLCRDFGLKQNSVEGVFAEGEPSAKKLKGLIDYCKNNKIKTVFVEDMVSPRVSETLAEAVGANTVKIYTAESKENNKTYLQCMVDNMKNIYASLEAKGK
jgi:zinc transport system substrate-binding protein